MTLVISKSLDEQLLEIKVIALQTRIIANKGDVETSAQLLAIEHELRSRRIFREQRKVRQ